MLRAAMALFSTLQIGARIKESFERSLRQAAVIAVAAVLLVAAAVFGLIAAYHALVSICQFDAAEAAAIMASVLLFVGLIVIAIALSMGRDLPRAAQSHGTASGAVGLSSRTLEEAGDFRGYLDIEAKQ